MGRAKCAGYLLAVLSLALLSACSLPGDNRRAPETFVLDPAIPTPFAGAETAREAPCGRMLVDIPASAPGYGSTAMLYRDGGYQLKAFAYHEWADVPSRMLEPLLRRTLEASGLFSAVLQAPTSASMDYRLETNSVRLRQVFARSGGSSVELNLQARLFDGNRLIGVQEFALQQAAAEDNAVAGVTAANQATAQLLEQVTDWVQQRLRRTAGACRFSGG